MTITNTNQSYAIEFLVCTVVGMVLGRFFFVDMEGTSGNNGVGVGVGGGIGGMGLGGGGGGDGGISLQGADLPPTHRSLHIPNNERDGTWGGGDPCCGIDDDDEDDDDDDNFEANNIRAPLLTDFPGVLQNPGISRRSAVGGERL